MTDAIAATDHAVFLALNGVVGAAVYQHAPEDVVLPVVLIGDVDQSSPIGGPGDIDRRLPLTIVVLTEGEERAPCAAILARVVALLDGAKLRGSAGWTIAPVLDGTSAQLSEDGLGYIGLAQFTVLALSD